MFDVLTKDYLKKFQKLVEQTLQTGSTSTEMATRPIVHDYIEKLIHLACPKNVALGLYHDTSYTRIHRPDWRIENNDNFGIYFFGDQKNLSLNKPFTLSKAEKIQIEGYLKLGHPVFVFDGIEFLIYTDNIKNLKKYEIIKKPLNLEDNWSEKEIDDSVLENLKKLLNNAGFRKWTELALITKLAYKAQFIALEIEALLSIPKGSGVNEEENLLIDNLVELNTMLEKHHDPILSSPLVCANFVAQVLTFGLFYAHTRQIITSEDPSKRKEAIKEFWEDGFLDHTEIVLRPFKAILEHCEGSLNRENVLSGWYQEVLGILAHAEYMGTDYQPLDFHTLFEEFFKAFDPKQRFDKGAFYTPSDLGDWMVSATKNYIIKEYDQKLSTIIDNVIDPCCGTGSLLESVYKGIKQDQGQANNKNIKLTGFEILPAPYALANYRLKNAVVKNENIEVKFLLTDTLSDKLVDLPKITNENGFIKELMEANEASQPPIQLIIANPPSTNAVEYKKIRSKISNLMEVFRPPKEARKDRQNTQKALDNDAYRFLRWSAEIALKSERSIMALVMPGSLGYSTSFKYIRKWLLENFHDILILQIDSDVRKNASTQSLFNVMQGRLVFFAAHDNNKIERIKNKILYADISSKSRNDKIKFLKEFSLESFKNIECNAPNFLFMEQDIYPEDIWQACIPIKQLNEKEIGVFNEKCSGLKLAPTALLFHTDINILKRRSLELSGKGAGRNKSNNELIDLWFKGQQRPPSKDKLIEKVKNNLNTTNISKYSFRPFVSGYLLNSDLLFNALSETLGGGTRSRPEIRSSFEHGAIGLSVSPSTIDLGNELTRFSSFVWYLPDNDLVARGNAMVYCDKYSKKDNLTNQYILIDNISDQVKGLFKSNREVLFYIYSIISSNTYLKKFEGVLFGSSDPDQPIRIPFLKDKVLRQKLVVLGEKIANCERLEFMNSLEYTDCIELIKNEVLSGFNLRKVIFNDNNIELKDETDLKVIIQVRNTDVVNLSISGHRVVEKWLREKTYSYYRKSFESNDLTELLQLLSAIDLQLKLIKEVDRILDDQLEVQELIKF